MLEVKINYHKSVICRVDTLNIRGDRWRDRSDYILVNILCALEKNISIENYSNTETNMY